MKRPREWRSPRETGEVGGPEIVNRSTSREHFSVFWEESQALEGKTGQNAPLQQ